MKSSSIIFLILAVAVISFSSCEKEDSPPISSQTNFIGTSVWVEDVDPGTTEILESGKVLIIGQTSEWYEGSDIARVAGQSFWTVNWLMEADFSSAKLWGTAIINVGVETQEANPCLGKWELIWEGTLTNGVIDPETGLFSQGKISVDAVGTGKAGNVVCKTGHWTYTMDIAEGFVYKSEGYFK